MKRKVILAVSILTVLFAVSAVSAYITDHARTVSAAHAGNVQIKADKSVMDRYLAEEFPFEAAAGGD